MRSSAVVSAALAVLLLVLVAVGWPPLLSLDRSVTEELHRSAVAEPGFTQLNRVLSDWVWDPWTMRALISVVVVVLWWRHERLLALWLTVASLLTAAVQQGVKWAVGRERPGWPDPVDSAQYASLPSGHAMTATVSCGLLLWVLALHWRESWRGWSVIAVAALVSVLGVGWTRVYLGVHWPSDVVAGWLLGFCLVVVSIITFRRYGQGAGRAGPPGTVRRRMGGTR
ncbi:phosphatase PAP2 family protein [Streptomyces sp. NBC_01353]|uniref:phosphatase PAP2 family protein n=1 Tax=Streptomyces sp. NBC_01353 TaxID=2903835 RepID=UPI002E3233E8|nr:phosphatase PAP2 family protein [Streptomyces sp. NBC_01353]